jgi:hypothetical protein
MIALARQIDGNRRLFSECAEQSLVSGRERRLLRLDSRVLYAAPQLRRRAGGQEELKRRNLVLAKV